MTKTKKIFSLFILITIMAAGATMALKKWNKVYGYSSPADVKSPVFQTAYTGAQSLPPVDFEKAATAAVPSVVHIKTLTKFKETAGNEPQQNPSG